MNTTAGEIIALVAHAREVPATERQRFRDRIRGEPGVAGVLLDTCHRVEFYSVVSDADAPSRLARALPTGGRTLRGETAIRHSVAVAVGRDSVVIGEDQVLHQLREALDTARAAGALDPMLERLLSTALRAGRRARSWRQGHPRSLANLAVDLIERRIGPLGGRAILVVGAGTMGRQAVRAAVAAGARVALTSRSADRAADVAQATGARVEDLDPGSRVAGFDGIVVALRGTWPIGPAAINAIARSPTPVVDLSVPSAIPARLSSVLSAWLTTADDLAKPGVTSAPIPDRTLTRLDDLIDRTAGEFVAWFDARERRAAASALVERADREREAELTELWRRLPDLDLKERETIEGMSRHLAERLLRDPLERLAADADGRHERAVRELWAL